MNYHDTLAYVRGVPQNVFEKEIPRLVRMSGASAILSCGRRMQYTSCYVCLIFLECTALIVVKNLCHILEH